jgi:hypothetical protein
MKHRLQHSHAQHHSAAEFRLAQIRDEKPTEAPGLTVRPSPLHGLGCFATRRFRKGRRIAEYDGLRVRFADLTEAEAPWDLNYLVGIDDVWAIDGSRGGNQTRYINHSCEPNVYLRITRGHAIFYALREIESGEELLWDYVITDGAGRVGPCPCELNKEDRKRGTQEAEETAGQPPYKG